MQSLARGRVERELAPSALREERQKLAAAVAAIAPAFRDRGELVDLAVALLAADLRLVHGSNLPHAQPTDISELALSEPPAVHGGARRERPPVAEG